MHNPPVLGVAASCSGLSPGRQGTISLPMSLVRVPATPPLLLGSGRVAQERLPRPGLCVTAVGSGCSAPEPVQEQGRGSGLCSVSFPCQPLAPCSP